MLLRVCLDIYVLWHQVMLRCCWVGSPSTPGCNGFDITVQLFSNTTIATCFLHWRIQMQTTHARSDDRLHIGTSCWMLCLNVTGSETVCNSVVWHLQRPEHSFFHYHYDYLALHASQYTARFVQPDNVMFQQDNVLCHVALDRHVRVCSRKPTRAS